VREEARQAVAARGHRHGPADDPRQGHRGAGGPAGPAVRLPATGGAGRKRHPCQAVQPPTRGDDPATNREQGNTHALAANRSLCVSRAAHRYHATNRAKFCD
jgi:hypothetical protein